MRWPRFVHRIYADLTGYFWLPCPLCGEMFGGHEWLPGNTLMSSLSEGHGVCPDCGDLAREQNAKQSPRYIRFEDWEAEHFEDWVAEQMKDPEFRAAVEELGPAYQA
ncbi:unnamed protein product, partial [marine sediment metagenome]